MYFTRSIARKTCQYINLYLTKFPQNWLIRQIIYTMKLYNRRYGGTIFDCQNVSQIVKNITFRYSSDKFDS